MCTIWLGPRILEQAKILAAWWKDWSQQRVAGKLCCGRKCAQLCGV